MLIWKNCDLVVSLNLDEQPHELDLNLSLRLMDLLYKLVLVVTGRWRHSILVLCIITFENVMIFNNLQSGITNYDM